MEVTVPAACDGVRVDRALALLTGVSRATASALVHDGRVALDGEPVRVAAARVRAHQRLAADLEAREPAHPQPDPGVDVAVVHADDDVIVVDKPAGLVVHPGPGHADTTLAHGLLARFPELAGVGDPDRPGIVHRLDAGTSGLLVVARTRTAYNDLVRQLAAHEVDRRYRALVWGVPEAGVGLVDAPIGRSGRDPTKMAVSRTGRAARTRYETLEAFIAPAPLALLVCRLQTGRTHQVRVHLAAIGHPVVGDATYGGARPALPVGRPLLHAAELGFRHPGTGEWVRFEAPLPADFAAVLARLGATTIPLPSATTDDSRHKPSSGDVK